MESMRDELIEAAARALCAARGDDPDDTTGGCHRGGLWLDEGEPWWTGDKEVAGIALDAILERMKEPILAVIDARVEMYEKKAEASDPLAPDDCNSHERRKDHALAVEYLKPEMEAMLSTLSPPPALT